MISCIGNSGICFGFIIGNFIWLACVAVLHIRNGTTAGVADTRPQTRVAEEYAENQVKTKIFHGM
jgi:hypothetical protein